MTLRRGHCPSPAELERAYWVPDADEAVSAHVDGCSRCGAAWAEIQMLRDLGRQIAAPAPSPQRREEIRTTLLSTREVAAPAPEPQRRWLWLPVAAAAAIVAVWFLWPSAAGRPAAVLAHDGARYLVASVPPDEMLRLVDGTITVDVGRLPPGARTRVITGDAEVTLDDAVLDVTAHGDRLSALRVIRGRVEVRSMRGDAFLVTAGETWTAPLVTDPAATSHADAGPERDAGLDTLAASPDAAPPGPSRRHRVEAVEAVEAIEPVEPRAPDAGLPPPVRTAAQAAFDDGWTAIRAGDFAAAAVAFDRAATLGVDARLEEDALFWRAVALARARDAAAIRAFSHFVDTYPSSPRAGEASVALGWLLVERGDAALAVRRFQAAVGDRSPRVRDSAARGLRAAGR